MAIDMVQISDVSLSYQQQTLCEQISLQLQRGHITALLGPSGVGKSSLLRYIAGLLQSHRDALVVSGSITDQDGNAIDQHIAYMAQNDALLPWLTVANNVSLSATLQKKPVNNNQLTTILKSVGLSAQAAAYPQQLSGGMRQRCALARTLYQDKAIVLMDEPFSSLDVITRQECQQLSKNCLSDKIVLLITHDPYEALSIADEILVMSGKPAQLYPFNPQGDIVTQQRQLMTMLQEAKYAME